MKERRVYTAEFKQEAVRLCEQPGARRGANRYGTGRIGPQFIQVAQASERARRTRGFQGNGKVVLTAEQQENLRLRKELERVKQERDILKNRSLVADHHLEG